MFSFRGYDNRISNTLSCMVHAPKTASALYSEIVGPRLASHEIPVKKASQSYA